MSERSITVRTPASSANLGPGFDSLGLAFQLYCTINFKLLETNDQSIPLVSLEGELAKGLPRDQNNLIYRVLKNLWQEDRDLLQYLRITVESQIPLGKGLGSSAAAIMGSVYAAYSLTRNMPEDYVMLGKATQIEGHADNVAASLLGGLVVCANSKDHSIVKTQKLTWPEQWATIAVVPGYSLSTERARSVIPKQVPHSDAVHNVQRVALLVSAVANKDEEAMAFAMHDSLHEPYRLPLVPELADLRIDLHGYPLIGCVMSGAGSSVLLVVHERSKADILQFLESWRSKRETPVSIMDLKVEPEGLQFKYD